MRYSLLPTQKFQEEAKKLLDSEPKAFEKLSKLLNELVEHPRTCTGHPERLKHYSVETWSRQISNKHRLVYEIHDDTVIIVLLTTYDHYSDK